MATIWEEWGIAEENIGTWLEEATETVTGLTTKVEAMLLKEGTDAPLAAVALKTVVGDLETLIPELETAATAKGVNFSADSVAYKALMQLVADMKTLAPLVETATEDLEKLE